MSDPGSFDGVPRSQFGVPHPEDNAPHSTDDAPHPFAAPQPPVPDNVSLAVSDATSPSRPKPPIMGGFIMRGNASNPVYIPWTGGKPNSTWTGLEDPPEKN